MKLAGTMVARNERWVLGLSLRAALLAADEMILLDHASTDGTADLVGRIAEEHPGRVHFLREEDPVWHEREIRQRLLEAARARGATHLISLDADEVITGNLLPSLRGLFASLAPGEALRLPWLALWRSLDRYRDDEDRLSRIVRDLGYRDSPDLHCASRVEGYDIHCRELKGTSGQREPLASMAEGGVFHLAFASLRRHRSKLAWYKMIETLRFSWRFTPEQLNDRYDRFLNEQGLRTSPVDPAWWAPYASWLGELDLEGEGWHGEECRRLWTEHGMEPFAGLELWDILNQSSPSLA